MAAFIMLVGDSAAMVAGDTAIKNLIEARGHTATVRTQTDAENLGAHLFVVIARSCNSAGLGTKYQTSAVPVLVGGGFGSWNNFTTGGGGFSGISNSVTILDDASPLAGGLTEADHLFTNTSANHAVYVAPAASGVVVVGHNTGGPGYLFLWYVPAGGNLVTGTAPALRIGILWESTSNANLNANGIAIWNGGIQMIEAIVGGGAPAGQPTIKRGRGIPGMRLGGTTFGQGF